MLFEFALEHRVIELSSLKLKFCAIQFVAQRHNRSVIFAGQGLDDLDGLIDMSLSLTYGDADLFNGLMDRRSGRNAELRCDARSGAATEEDDGASRRHESEECHRLI